MRHKGDVESLDGETLDAFLESGGCTPDDPGTKVNQIRSVVDDNRSGGTRPLWIGSRSACAEEHDLRLRWRGLRGPPVE